ncbi:MAG: TIGR04084 family radical SAM/SPASM domain-containing protein [Candidatus Asgardarchaeia archaeon]
MLYFITLTQVCNLNCKYCGNMPDPTIAPIELSYDLSILKSFLSKDGDVDICFYGGEPLLRIPLIKKIMDEIPANHYILQTNGLLLKKLDTEYLNKFDTILISIDGRKEITDYYRGTGTYDKVMENLRDIRERGFEGDVIARMAVSGKSDIFLEVKHLIELKPPYNFDHVHWQLDVLWDFPPKQRYDNYEKWVSEVYNPGITKLVNYWYSTMVNKQKILGIVPFLGIMKTLLYNETTELRCGAGINAFAITTDGRITVCPIAPEFKFATVGTIFNSSPHDLPYKVTIGEPCLSCEYYHICGGRCLFANKTKLWGEKGFLEVCDTVKHLIRELMRIKPEIEKLIAKGIFMKEDFNYPPYNNSTEIIP